MTRQLALRALIGCWGIGVAIGFTILMDYQNRPGPLADPPPAWPVEIEEVSSVDGPVLLVFAHPRCACTEATMGELARLMRHAQGHLTTHVFFTQPEKFDAAWARGTLWQKAAAIPGVTPHLDPEARAAHQFGAYTSGQALLYDAKRRLVFNGGITGSRGHEGNNKGRQAITEWIATNRITRSTSFVFGCLLDEEPAVQQYAHDEPREEVTTVTQ